MVGIPPEFLKAIEMISDGIFDKMAFRLLGNIPSLRDKKLAIISTEEHYNLPGLFVQSLNRAPNKLEEDVLKNLLENANHYIDALKAKTKAKIYEDIVSIGIKDLDPEKLKSIISENLNKSGNHFKTIAESEATKTRNTGRLLTVAQMASGSGIEDPNVYFVLVRDNVTCKFCVDNHTIDGTTPKVFKLSEVKVTYLTKEEKHEGRCSISGQHPNCRCGLTYLPPNYGFKNGRIAYIKLEHDEHKAQNT